MKSVDVLIIGAGITGTAIAYECSKYQLSIALVEAENDVSMKTTKANSGIVHAGYDPLPGTLMARLNVEGSKLTRELAPVLGFHYDPIGSLVIGSTESDHAIINELFDRGKKNGVEGLSILKTAKEVHKLDPNLAPEINYALLAKSAAVCAPWEIALAFAYTAVTNGASFYGDSPVTDILLQEDGRYLVKTPKGDFLATYVFNAAGTHADDVYRLVLKEEAGLSFRIRPCKGEYYLLDKEIGSLVHHVIFQTPTKLGKGVLVAPTVHKNLIVGPNAMYENAGKDDVSTTNDALSYIRKASERSVPGIRFFQQNIRNFSGVRAALEGREDFLIEESPIRKNFFNFAGIKSPGVSCGPAFGKEAVRLLEKAGAPLVEKKYFKNYRLETPFVDLTPEEKEAKIRENPHYGQVICRCETVTEGEILDALHAPIPATTIDGVKRRTNAGMGRCQGGFCGPKVFDMIRTEDHLPFDQVYQDRTGSSVVVSKTKEGETK